MGEHVILHRFEEVERGVRGQRRVAETGVFDVDDKDNPDWVKKALAERAKAEAERAKSDNPFGEHRLAETEPSNDGGNVALVLNPPPAEEAPEEKVKERAPRSNKS